MTRCACPGPRTTTIAFSGGLELRRCRGCERNTWLLGGRPVSLAVAGDELRARFHRLRGARVSPLVGAGARRPALNSAADLRRRRAVRHGAAPRPSPAEVARLVAAGSPDAVTALLASHGAPGRWQVLGA